jgi:hypothetical protein
VSNRRCVVAPNQPNGGPNECCSYSRRCVVEGRRVRECRDDQRDEHRDRDGMQLGGLRGGGLRAREDSAVPRVGLQISGLRLHGDPDSFVGTVA